MERIGCMEAKRSQDFLEMKSQMILGASGEHRQKFVEIAETCTPTQAYALAKFYAEKVEDFSLQAEEYARSCRFLSILKRDYGQEAFKQVVE